VGGVERAISRDAEMGITVLLPILLGLLAIELWAYQPTIQQMLLKLACALLPPGERATRHEEWQAYILEFPGELTRTFLAFGCFRAGVRISLRHVTAKLLRFVPILDDRKYGVMLMREISAVMEHPNVTVLDIRDVNRTETNGKVSITTILEWKRHGMTYQELEEELDLRAMSSVQNSRPVQLLRSGYSFLRYELPKQLWSE
jgi:hypothetical protein